MKLVLSTRVFLSYHKLFGGIKCAVVRTKLNPSTRSRRGWRNAGLDAEVLYICRRVQYMSPCSCRIVSNSDLPYFVSERQRLQGISDSDILGFSFFKTGKALYAGQHGLLYHCEPFVEEHCCCIPDKIKAMLLVLVTKPFVIQRCILRAKLPCVCVWSDN